MKKITFGIFAHVDAGKTTFSEELLYHTGIIRSAGRVDHKNTTLDAHHIERQRGITIFADQATFEYEGAKYYLIDTPGHIDFSAEAERTAAVLDYAVLLINGKEGVQSHTKSLFKLLKSYGLPVFIFINKIDLEGFSLEEVVKDIRSKLTENIVYINNLEQGDYFKLSEEAVEFLAMHDDKIMDGYLQDTLCESQVIEAFSTLIKNRGCFPVISGSALKDIGIIEFMNVFHLLTTSSYNQHINEPFTGRIYKVRHDEKGNRISYIKALTGIVRPKDSITLYSAEEEAQEKINELRQYTGSRYINLHQAEAGDVFAVTGISKAACGDYIGIAKPADNLYFQTALKSKVVFSQEIDKNEVLRALRVLEEEDPMLSVDYEKELEVISINVMGKIQLEILKDIIRGRFNLAVTFEKPEVLYRETIDAPIMGYGHFEPLRHYAEVNLRLEPLERGAGITFNSECHVDTLAENYQNLVKTHVFEKNHKGILTGFPITDINIVLVKGRAHLKHTEGGDFREATYRAIRQGLEKAQKVLLEPFYRFEIFAPAEFMGRIISDIQKLQGSFNISDSDGEQIHIEGRGPVATFMEYQSELLAATKGLASISFLYDGYDICHNPQEVIEKIGYDKGADTENSSGSVFCAKGAAYLVNWEEAENYMHCIDK